MKRFFLLLALFVCMAVPSVASDANACNNANSASMADSSVFVGRIENDEYQVYIVMDFYRKNITCPRQEIFGQNPGYFGAVRDTRKWIIEDSSIKGNTASLVIINDYGSDDLKSKYLKEKSGKTNKYRNLLSNIKLSFYDFDNGVFWNTEILKHVLSFIDSNFNGSRCALLSP